MTPNQNMEFKEWLEETAGFHNQIMTEEQFCSNGEIRCKVRCQDSDMYCFNDQCNLNEGHEGCHAYGLDSMLYGYFPKSTCDTENDVHDGSCSVCLVREVRDR